MCRQMSRGVKSGGGAGEVARTNGQVGVPTICESTFPVSAEAPFQASVHSTAHPLHSLGLYLIIQL